jgi:hypothetical protein
VATQTVFERPIMPTASFSDRCLFPCGDGDVRAGTAMSALQALLHAATMAP